MIDVARAAPSPAAPAREAAPPAVSAPSPAAAPAKPEARPAPAPPAAAAAPSSPGPTPFDSSDARVPLAPTAPTGDDLERLRSGWATIVAAISKSPPLKPLIVVCRPIGVEGNIVTLGFPEEQAFLKDVAERKRANLEERIGEFLGHEVGVRCVATNLDLLPPLPADAEAAHILAEAHRIFGEDLAEVPEVT
jgi:hypothetical protein